MFGDGVLWCGLFSCELFVLVGLEQCLLCRFCFVGLVVCWFGLSGLGFCCYLLTWLILGFAGVGVLIYEVASLFSFSSWKVWSVLICVLCLTCLFDVVVCWLG